MTFFSSLLAGLLEAAEDGLALHRALNLENFEVDPMLAVLARLVEAYLSKRATEVGQVTV